MAITTSPEELWRHPDPTSTPMWRFLQHINQKYGLQLAGYPDLYKWSVEDVALFWEEVWHFVGIKASKSFDKVRMNKRPPSIHTASLERCHKSPSVYERPRIGVSHTLTYGTLIMSMGHLAMNSYMKTM
jgi:hypothetical protein